MLFDHTNFEITKKYKLVCDTHNTVPFLSYRELSFTGKVIIELNVFISLVAADYTMNNLNLIGMSTSGI